MKKYFFGAALLFILLQFLSFGLSRAFEGNAVTVADTSGYRTGIRGTMSIGNGEDRLQSNLQEVRGFYRGISAGFLTGEEVNVATTRFLFDDVERISQMASLLELNVPDVLNSSASRADTLTVYQEELVHQQTTARDRGDILEKQIASLSSVLDQAQTRQNELETRVFTTIDQKKPLDAEEAFNRFLTAKQQTGELSSQVRVLETLRAKYTLAQQLFTSRLDFVRANREALIKGVQVVDLPDPQIKLILSRQEYEQRR